MLEKFEQNRMVQTTQNFVFFDKKQKTKTKTGLTKLFLTKRWRHFGRSLCNQNNCLMLTLEF